MINKDINHGSSFTPENDSRSERSSERSLGRKAIAGIALTAVTVFGASEVKDTYDNFTNMHYDLDGILNIGEQ